VYDFFLPGIAMTQTIRPTSDELAALDVFQGVDLGSISDLLAHCPLVSLEPEDILLRAGQHHGILYLVLSGRLSVHLDGPSTDRVATIEAGHTVGELSVLDESPASAFVIAETPVRLLAVNEIAFWRMVNVSHDFAINLLLLLVQRLRANNTAISDKVRQQRELQRRAILDALTGLYNRRWLDESLPRLISRYATSGRPLSLLMVDIDHFKKFNDTYGHVVGDHAHGFRIHPT